MPCVLQHRNHDPERGGREHDGDEERRLDESAGTQAKADEERDSERDRVPERGQAEQAAAKAVVLHLETGEKK
jgi:hypothetical protein